MYVKVGNVWKQGEAWVNVKGQWKKGIATWVKVNGKWETMTYRFTTVTTSPQTVKTDSIGFGSYRDTRWYATDMNVTPNPSNYPLVTVEFFARHKTIPRDTHLYLGFGGETVERNRLYHALLEGKASVSLRGPFVLTLDRYNSNISLSGSSGRVMIQPNSDDLIYNLLRDWVGKEITCTINID